MKIVCTCRLYTSLRVHMAEELSFERFHDLEEFRSMSCQVRTTPLKVRGSFASRGTKWMSCDAETRRTMVRNVMNLIGDDVFTSFLWRSLPDVQCAGQSEGRRLYTWPCFARLRCLTVVGKLWGESADLSQSYGKTATLNKVDKQPYLLSLTQITSTLCLSDVVSWLSAEDGFARECPPLQ